MDLKYLTPTQVVEVTYEGQARRFAVSSISQRRLTGEESANDLARQLGTLSVESRTQLWTVGWDTSVSIIENEVSGKSEPIHKVIPI